MKNMSIIEELRNEAVKSITSLQHDQEEDDVLEEVFGEDHSLIADDFEGELLEGLGDTKAQSMRQSMKNKKSGASGLSKTAKVQRDDDFFN